MAGKGIVWVGMSGGVDSTATALYLREQGYEVHGVTLLLHEVSCRTQEESRSFCGSDVARKASEVAARFDIPHEVIDARDRFRREVLEASWQVFDRGGTPNPCVFCNAGVRFATLVRVARERGADYLATGHYARLVQDPAGHFHLARGIDANKDQSYFLYGIPPELYPRILFPLGTLTKVRVREWIREHGLTRSADAPDSQDLCFAGPEGHFAEQLRLRFEGRAIPGDFVDLESGRVVGHHTGIHQFTIGQRKGLGFALGHPVKICKIDPQTGTITVSGLQSNVLGNLAASSSFRWLDGHPLPEGTRLSGQVRYRQKAVSLSVIRSREQVAEVRFDTPVFGITPGQSLVLYRGDQVVGGGPIDSTLSHLSP